MKVNVLVIEPFNGNQPGETVSVTEREAAQLEAKGLVKMALGGKADKSLPGPKENKAHPLTPAGQVAQLSAPPAGQASQAKTQTPSRRGRPPGRRNARSSR